MTVNDLVEALKVRVEEIVKDLRNFDESGLFRGITVYTGYAPNKQTIEETECPCIILRVLDGTVSGSSYDEKETVTIAAGVFLYQESARDPNETDTGDVEKTRGWDAVLQCITRIKNNLLKNRLLDNRYELEQPLKWEIPQEQPEPIWYGILTLKYSVDVPEDEDYEEVLSGRTKTANYEERQREKGYKERIDVNGE